MTPINCRHCGRVNSRSAKRCIWCGMPVIISEAPLAFEATRVEIAYLNGIERLDSPTPVHLEINAKGVEVAELMPGSRIVKIAADELIEANAIDASVMAEKRGGQVGGLWDRLRAFFLPGDRRARDQTKKLEYVLAIKYRSEGEVRSAVFRREDEGGLAVIEKLSRLIAMLIELKRGRGGE